MTSTTPASSFMGEPDPSGRFGRFGGRFIPETLMPACIELDAAFREAWADPAFRAELDELLGSYAGRPSPLTECHRLSEEIGIKPREVQPLDIQATLDELTQRRTDRAVAVQELDRLDQAIQTAQATNDEQGDIAARGLFDANQLDVELPDVLDNMLVAINSARIVRVIVRSSN